MGEAKSDSSIITEIKAFPNAKQELANPDSAFLAYRILTPPSQSALKAHEFLGTDSKATSTDLETVAVSAVLRLVANSVEKKANSNPDLTSPDSIKRESAKLLQTVLTPGQGEDRTAYMSRLIGFLTKPEASG